ncbi:MAG: hypothetical protein WDO71_02040 [Bacteroidota bacterium]
MDAANSELWDAKKKKYVFHKSSGKEMTSDQLVKYWAGWGETISYRFYRRWYGRR